MSNGASASAKRRGGREARARVARERALEDLEEPLRQRAARLAQRVDAAVADREEHRELPAAGEERLAEEHLAEHGRRREEVGAVVERLARDLLGREVGELPLEHRARRAERSVGAARRPRDAEVAELHAAVDRQVDVRRRDVAVDDAHRLRRPASRAVCTLSSAPQDARARCAPATPGAERAPWLDEPPQQPEEVAAVDELHRQPGLVADDARSRRP